MRKWAAGLGVALLHLPGGGERELGGGVWIQKACLLEMLDACVLLVLLVEHDWCGVIKGWLGRAGLGRAELS